MEATWDTLLPSTAQQVKVETSPTGSLLSDPAGVYPSLFSGSTVASSAAATPTDTSGLSLGMFPASSDDVDFASKTAAFQSSLASLAEEAVDESNSLVLVDQENTEADLAAASDKKPAKKRKSWGQVLPEPKTNLPPRKRAKTEDEKEQRRVERVLRNRRAAQSSRERKRLEVEALEIRNRELEEQLAKVRRENTMLYERLTQVQGKSAVVPTANVPVTLSQELFSSQNGHSFTPESSSSLGSFLNSATINPVSLSPALHPVPDTSDVISTIDDQESTAQAKCEKTEQQEKIEQASTQKQNQSPLVEHVAAKGADLSATDKLESSPDTTHRPAATLCPDLQCLSAEVSQAWNVPKNLALLSATLFYQTTLLLMLSSTMISACSRPLNQIALLLKAGISIPPTPAILTSIIWLITTPSRRSMARSSTWTTSSTPTVLTSHLAATSSSATVASTRPGLPSSTLRLKMLRKILTSNPMLARPIRDATMRVLRSVCSEERLDVVMVGGQVRPNVVRATQWAETGIATDGSWPNKATRPSKEALITLLWALQVEERRISMPARNKSQTSSARARTSFFGEPARGLGKLSMKRW